MLPSFCLRVLRFLCVLGALAVLPVQAQSGEGEPGADGFDRLSPSSHISLITGLPGDQLHTEFGHSAIRVYDPVSGVDSLYNYGTFSFRDPYFVPKFIYGELNYFLSVSTYGGMQYVYRRLERPIVEQRLTLTLEQRNALYRFLQINRRSENRYYRYDFLYDNCSTRVRDAFREAIGDDVTFSDAKPDVDRTFRQMLDLYVHDRPMLDLGFDLGLGMPADADVSPQEAMFLPEFLMEGFDHATVEVGGETRPLVASTDTLLWREGYDARRTVFPWTVALAWALGGLALGWTGWQAKTRRRPGRWGDAALLSGAGVAGLLIVFLWFIALYDVTTNNWNLAWALPTHLVAAVALVRRSDASWVRTYLAGAAGLTALLAVTWPVLPQNLHPAVFPLVLVLAVRLGWQAAVRYPTFKAQLEL